MPIQLTGQAQVRSKDDGQVYTIAAREIDWDQVGSDDRNMGLEVHYRGDITHPVLGELSWTASEYPVGMFNDADSAMNGHTLVSNFSFDSDFGGDDDWDDGSGPEQTVELTEEQLVALTPEEQQEHLAVWFHSQFWDPVQETPYNGREGGYQYVWGGPYDAQSELEDKFAGIIDEGIIAAATEEIEADGITDWAPSPQHPDQLQAAEDYYESMREPTLADIEAALKSGVKLDFSSPAAAEAAAELKRSAEALIAALDARQPVHGGMGHNGPALDDAGNPLPDGFEDELRKSAVAIAAEFEAETPDVQAVVAATSNLQRLRAWLALKADLAADEFAKALGKNAARGAIVIGGLVLGSIVPGLDIVIDAGLTWLHALLV